MTRLRTRLIAGLGVLSVAAAGTLLPLTPAATADAAPAPNPWATTSITKTYDGTGHGTPAQTFINAANDFAPGDNTSDDGVVASRDTVDYSVNTVIEGAAARTVQVVFDLPEYLTFDPKLNTKLCTSSTFVKASFTEVDGKPACNYEVPRGVGAALQHNLVLTAKDTAGRIEHDQVVTASIGLQGQPSHSSTTSEAVTVMSAPTADLVLRPSTCNASGACGSLDAATTTGSFEVMVEPLRWPGYNTAKGASTLTPWSAQLDVSAFPADTTWSVDSVALTPKNGRLSLNDYVGNKTISFTVPSNWGGEEFAEGEHRSFDAHLIVPSTALGTPDFKNNGTGWQPGDDEAKGVSTLNMRESGARRGYIYANNDWTAVSIYKPTPVPGDIFAKTQTRPWDSSDSLWSDGNKLFSEGSSQTVSSVYPYSSAYKYWDMVPGTQLLSEITARTQNAPVPTMTNLIISDQWDTDYVIVDPSRPAYVTGPEGEKITTGFTMQWSRSVVGETVIDSSNEGWITSTTPVTGAKSARVIFDEVPSGTSSGAGAYSFFVPTIVRDDLVEPDIPVVTDDRMYSTCEECTGEGFIAVPISIVTMGTPALDVDVRANAVELDQSTNLVKYTVTPTVGALMDSSALINGTLVLQLDPCIIETTLAANSKWEIINEDLTLGCGAVGNNTVTLKLKDHFLPSKDMSDNTTAVPQLVFDATYSMLAQEHGTISAVWSLTDIDGIQADKLPDVVDASDSVTITIPERTTVAQQITTSTPKVEVDETLKFQAIIEANDAAEAKLVPTETVVVLPGKGDDAAFAALLSAYDGPEASSFTGTYTLTSATVDGKNSVAGTTVLCTADANPGLDPAQGNWSTTCGPNTTALKIVQPASDHQGVSVIDFELQPIDNSIDDVYVAWIGQTVVGSVVAGMSYPAVDVVVASHIYGYVYWDVNGRGMDRNPSPPSPGIEGITVELLDNTATVIATTTTNAAGYYQFRDYHSGQYTTRVPAIGSPGGVPATVDSKFDPDKVIDVTQTFSFPNQRLSNATTTSSAIDLGVDTTVPNVNFGFFAPDPYSDLMKKAAQVRCPADPGTVCDVSWDITVTNPSNMTLTGGVLQDSTSKQVYDIEATIGEKVIDVVSRNGDGGYALTTLGHVYAWGYGQYGANGDGSTTDNLTAQLVRGLNDVAVVDVVARSGYGGGYVLTDGGAVYSWGYGYLGSNGNGSTYDNYTAQLVRGLNDVTVAEIISRGQNGGYALTTDGTVYSWGKGGSGSNGNGATGNNLTAQPVQGLEGLNVVEVINRAGDGGYALTADGDVYAWGRGDYSANGNGTTSSSNRTAQLVQGLGGVNVVEIVDRNTYGGYALTADGDVYAWGRGDYSANGNGTTSSSNRTAKLVRGLEGLNVIEIISRNEYGGYALTDGGAVYSWGYGSGGANGNDSTDDNLTAQLVQGFEGVTVVDITGRNNGGYALTDGGAVYSWGYGYYGTNGNGTMNNNLTAQLVQGLEGVTVAEIISREQNGGQALTTDGAVYSWGSGSSGSNGDGSTNDNLTAQLVQGLENVTAVEITSRGIYGGYALTANNAVYSWGAGWYGTSGNGSNSNNLTAQPVRDLPAATPLALTNEQLNGDFVGRRYQLPNLAPGQTASITISGKVNKPSFNDGGLVIGNQAWESFNQTPMLTVPSLPDPALPPFDSANPTAYGKWTGNSACAATTDWETPGDQCDQVYASVPTTTQPLGALEGHTWFDENRDGVMGTDEPRLVNVKVTLWKGVNGEFTTKVGETITDTEGHYDFTSLVPSTDTAADGYYVIFAPANDPELSTGTTLLGENQSWIWTDSYDQAPWYADDRSASEDGMTRNIEVLGNQTTGLVNGGVVVYTADIDVRKGHVGADDVFTSVHTPPLDADKPGWTTTTPVTAYVTNTGDEPLVDLVFTDAMTSGEQVAWNSCTIDGPAIDLTGAWTDGVYSHTFDPELSLAVGATMTCTGTLPAMSTDTTAVHVDTVDVAGNGSITGSPAWDEATFTANPPSPEELPTPAISLEKGILEPIGEGTDCTAEANAKDPSLCRINPGTVTLPGGVEQTITFRATNTGTETLLDMALDDVTVVGDANVTNIACQWPTTNVDGRERRVLAVGEVALCSGTLTLPNTPAGDGDHQNHAEVWAVGHISRTTTHGEADFTAKPEFNPGVAPELPRSGGTGTMLFVLVGLGILAGTAASIRMRRHTTAQSQLS